MATFSKTIMIGRLTADPEIRTTTSGKTVCNFTLAVDRRFDREKADFFQAVAWSKTAEFITQYFHKGDQLLVCGPLQTHSFDAQDGRKITVTEIFVEEAQFVDRQKPREESEQKHEPDHTRTRRNARTRKIYGTTGDGRRHRRRKPTVLRKGGKRNA